MPFIVRDLQDLIRLLAEHPEWRAELRRHGLSDELLELPALVRQVAEQLATLTTRIERLEATVERLAEAQGRTEARVGRVEGAGLELRYARRAPAYLSRLARRLRVLETGPLADLVLAGRRCQDDAEVYLLADISAGVGPHDVEREAGAAPPRSRRSDGRVFRPRVS